MPNAAIDSESLTRFAADPLPYLEKLRREGVPLLLKSDSGADVVVQDAASYQRLLDSMERLETIAAVKEGQRDVAAGRTRSMPGAMAELARKHQLPPTSAE